MAIPEVEWIWKNGTFVPWRDATVHVLTHALHYGSGVFEGVRAYRTPDGTAVFRLRDHIERLARSATTYYMDLGYDIDELCSATKELVRKNGLESAYIRPIAFRGYGEMGLFPLKAPVEVAIAAWPWGAYLGEEGIMNGIHVKTSSFRRIDVNALPPAVKATGQYINSILAKVEAVKDGYEEAILLDSRGFLSEGSGENLFLVKNGTLLTPSTASAVLEGITRHTIMTLAADAGIPVVERDLVRSDLYACDEAFLTGTAAEIVPIREVDRRAIGDPGPVTRTLQEAFFAIVREGRTDYPYWLEYV